MIEIGRYYKFKSNPNVVGKALWVNPNFSYHQCQVQLLADKHGAKYGAYLWTDETNLLPATQAERTAYLKWINSPDLKTEEPKEEKEVKRQEQMSLFEL